MIKINGFIKKVVNNNSMNLFKQLYKFINKYLG